MKVDQITEKLSNYPIAKIEELYAFNLRSDAKVNMTNYLSGFFQSLSEGHSLRIWADKISSYLPAGVGLSKAGLQKRLGPRQLSCLEALLKHSLREGLEGLVLQTKSLAAGWFDSFGKVYVEDSVCMKLNKALAEVFPGSHSPKGPTSTARLQVRMDLKRLEYEHFSLSSYGQNDQKYSGEIVSGLQAGDLVLGDLGYWDLETFRKIIDQDAFVLSRYKSGVHLYLPKAQEALNLLKKTQIKQETHLRIFLHLFLLYLVLFYVPYYRSYAQEIYEEHRELLSFFLFADFLKRNFLELVAAQIKQQQEQIIQRLLKLALYEKRKQRIHQLQLLYRIRKPRLITLIEPQPIDTTR